jgi:hypothetical protein
VGVHGAISQIDNGRYHFSLPLSSSLKKGCPTHRTRGATIVLPFLKARPMKRMATFCHDVQTAIFHADAHLGFGRITALEIEALIMLGNLV